MLDNITQHENMSPDTLEALRKRAKGNLYYFSKGILGYDFIDPVVHLSLCRVLELYDGYDDSLEAPIEEYKSVLRQMIERHLAMNGEIWSEDLIEERIQEGLDLGVKKCKFTLPRGWLKTTMCSISYPLWRAIRDSNVRVMVVQNTYTNACSKLQSIKGQVDGNKLFRVLFKDLLPGTRSKWKNDSLCLTRKKAFAESTFEAAGVRTQVTSRHYDLIIEDDTVAPESDDLTQDIAVPSKEDVDMAIGWHKLTTPLLVDPGLGQNLVVGTRWAEHDILSYIDKKEKYYWSVERACREDVNGLEDVKGESCYKSRFPDHVLEQIEISLGPYMFAALYRNKPMSASDMTFKPEWMLYYETEPQGLIIYTTMDLATDPATAKGSKLDYNVIITTGKSLYSGHVYVLDIWRKHANPLEVINELFRQVDQWGPVRIGCESVAYQSTLLFWIKEAQSERDKYFAVEGITHGKRAKGARIQGLQPSFADLKVHMRRQHGVLVNELLSFPMGENDDVIDALSMQLKYWQMTRATKDARPLLVRDNPLSLDFALAEIKERSKPTRGFLADTQRIHKDPKMGRFN